MGQDDRPATTAPVPDHRALIRRWVAVVGALADTGPTLTSAGDDLLDRYGGPGRAYHTVEHLAEVLEILDRLCGRGGVPVPVELAGWFHDVVYDPRAAPGWSEDASAAAASDLLGPLGVPTSVLAETVRLIRTTATHVPAPGDDHAGLLADADLWILGSPPDRYERYVGAVRREYGFLTDVEWQAGRSAVVRGFVARPRLYVTDRAHLAFDAAARANLAWELTTLGGAEPQP